MAKKDAQQYPFAAGEIPGPFEITLHSTEGGSDKLYQIIIQPFDTLFLVNYANGRRGGTMATGTKTNDPVNWETARKLCNKLLNEKVGKGYNPISGTAIGSQASEMVVVTRPTDTGVRPQLLNAITEDELERFLKDDDYIAQPKHDGERRMVLAKEAVPTGINRKGQTVTLSSAIAAAVVSLSSSILIDNEQIGDRLHVFDLLEIDGSDLRSRPLGFRLAHLLKVFGNAGVPINDDYPLCLIETAWCEREKRALLNRISQEGGEGIVFKRIDAPYEPGRPNSGGTQFKFKLYDTLSAVVAAVNAQRSVAIELIEGDGRRIQVGNVTVPSNQTIPSVGDVVEVRYLYAYEGGSLYQPTLLGVRSDIEVAECLARQRKFKAAIAA